MILSDKVSASLVNALCQNKKIDPEYKEAHEYCMEQLLDIIFYHLILLVIGSALHRFGLTCLYIISLTPVKMLAGGAHANSRGMCSIISYGVFLAVILLCPYLPISKLSIIILCLPLEVILFLLTPVCHPNKVFTPVQRRHIKRNLLIYLTGLTIIGLIFTFSDLLIPLRLLFLCLVVVVGNQALGIALYRNID